MTTGEIIKFLRNRKGLTQNQLAEILGVKLSSIQKYESNSVNNLKMDVIRKLVKYFRFPPWAFIFPEHIKMKNDKLEGIYLDENMLKTFANCNLLNNVGREKVNTYARDLVDSGNYTRK